MIAADELAAYAQDLQQAILLEGDVEGAEQMRSEVFTRHLIDVLIEAGEIENAVPCHHNDRGIDVHGYGIDDDDTLNLIGTIYAGVVPPTNVTPTEINRAAQRLMRFWDRCRDEPYYQRLEESSEAFDMALHVHQSAGAIRRVRLFVITDGLTTTDVTAIDSTETTEIRRSVWDIQRLFRLDTSGQPREPIQIDFVKRFGAPLPCLQTGKGRKDYDAMLAVVPGAWLADVYNEYGARLLELNVRSFLQAAGKVNRGIRDTLRSQPERFLAYNNGISATASEVELVELADGGCGIAAVRDLQIVNGGQTTASVHRALVTGVNLDEVSVQAKITVVALDALEEIVPLISRYANSQNKVSEADLRANDPFHVELESLSRTVWTGGDAIRQTRWFYERARGQYRDEMSRQGSPARQRTWKAAHPNLQRFTKTDVAKFENTWAQLPHEVSRGAQKNFTVFMGLLAQSPVKPTPDYFYRLIAKAILWKRAERLVTEQQFGGYRANLVAYAIAKLSHSTAQRIDLLRIWENQALDAAVEDSLVQLSRIAWKVLVDGAPPGANITEWAKREQCWRAMRDEAWEVPPGLAEGLVLLQQRSASTGATTPDPDDPAVAACANFGADAWYALSHWAKQTANLQPWQRKLAFDIGTRIKRGRPPSSKQAQYGIRILDEARRLGFVE